METLFELTQGLSFFDIYLLYDYRVTHINLHYYIMYHETNLGDLFLLESVIGAADGISTTESSRQGWV